MSLSALPGPGIAADGRPGSLLGLILILVLVIVLINLWVWRDMAQRRRPVWLRWVVMIGGYTPLQLGLLVYLFDLRRHPHDSSLSRRDVLFQRWRNPPP